MDTFLRAPGRAVFPLITMLFLLGFILIPAPWAQQQEPFLSGHINRATAKVGEIVEITLTYILPEGAKPLSPPEIKGFEEMTVLDVLEKRNQLIVRLLVDRLGSWVTGDISLSYRESNGEIAVVETAPVSLTVLSNLGEKPEEAQLKPIRDIIPARPLWLKYVLWAFIMLAVAGVALFLIRCFMPGRKGVLYKKTDDPPHIRARKEIEELEGLKLFESGEVKQFYFRFSEITRDYLEDLRQFPAAEYTTEEIAIAIREEKDRRLVPILREADLAKFSDLIPSPAKKEEQVKAILSYISETGIMFENGEKEGISGGRAS